MANYSAADRTRWHELAARVGGVEAAALLGFPTTRKAIARWSDEAGAPLELDDDAELLDDDVDELTDDRLKSTLARLVLKIDERMTSELYVSTPVGLKVQPLTGAELGALAAALERIVSTHRLLNGEAGDIVEHRHTLGPAQAKLLDRSLAATRQRRALVIDTQGRTVRAS